MRAAEETYQGAHETWPWLAAKVPSAQSVHTVDPWLAAKRPRGQSAHCDWPLLAVKRPGAQAAIKSTHNTHPLAGCIRA